MWCAYYDDLGAVGILNCGATANNNVNIDVVGDMPTGCGSDYMVAVTPQMTAMYARSLGMAQRPSTWVLLEKMFSCPLVLLATVARPELRLRVLVWRVELPWCTVHLVQTWLPMP